MVYRIDPATNTVVAEIPAGDFAHGILVQPEAVWISNAHEETVTRIDPSTNETLFVDGPGPGSGWARGADPSGRLRATEETSSASTRRPARRSRWCTSVAGHMASLPRTPRYGCPTASYPSTGSPSASSMSRRCGRWRRRLSSRSHDRAAGGVASIPGAQLADGEPRPFQHRLRPDVGRAARDLAAALVQRVSLQRLRAVRAGIVDRGLEERRRRRPGAGGAAPPRSRRSTRPGGRRSGGASSRRPAARSPRAARG